LSTVEIVAYIAGVHIMTRLNTLTILNKFQRRLLLVYPMQK